LEGKPGGKRQPIINPPWSGSCLGRTSHRRSRCSAERIIRSRSSPIPTASDKTHCSYKNDAAYYTIRTGGSAAENAVWTYEDPYPAVAAIKGHLAFYPDRVDRIEELPRR